MDGSYLLVELDLSVQVVLGECRKVFILLCVKCFHFRHSSVQDSFAARSHIFVGLNVTSL